MTLEGWFCGRDETNPGLERLYLVELDPLGGPVGNKPWLLEPCEILGTFPATFSTFSPPPSSGPCLPPCGGLAHACGTCLPAGARSSTATLFDCPPVPPESVSVDLAFLEAGRNLAGPGDDESILLMPDTDTGCPLIMVEPVRTEDHDSLGGFRSPLVGVYLGVGGLELGEIGA